jgi:hypothetical protein
LLPVVTQLDGARRRAQVIRATDRVTGLSAIAARNSADMIGKLNQALTVEIVTSRPSSVGVPLTGGDA